MQNNQHIIRQFQETLVANDVVVPHFNTQNTAPEERFTINVVSDTPETQALQARFLYTMEHCQDRNAYTEPPTLVHNELGRVETHVEAGPSLLSAPVAAMMHPQEGVVTDRMHPHGLDSDLIGVHFVLALEQRVLHISTRYLLN